MTKPTRLTKGESAVVAYKPTTITRLVSQGWRVAEAQPKEPTVDDVLKAVGDDADKAAEALVAENLKGDAARSTLVAKLEAVLRAASDQPSETAPTNTAERPAENQDADTNV